MRKLFFLKVVFFGLLCYTIACNNATNTSEKIVPKEEATNLIALGTEQRRLGNYQEALSYFSKAYEEAKTAGDEQTTATLLNNLGLVHWRLDNNEEAMECYTQAAALAEKNNMQRLLGLTYTNRALILKEARDFTAAFEQNNKAIQLFQETKAPKDLAIVYNNQGQIYRFSGNLDQALSFYLRSLEACEQINYTEGMATAYQNLSTVYTQQGDFQKALKTGHTCLSLSYKANSKVRISEGLEQLATTFEAFHQPDSALLYFKKHHTIAQQILEANQSELLAQNQAKLGYEVKKLQIQKLEIEKENANNRFLFIVVSIIAIVLVVAFFSYRYFSIVNFRKKQLELKLQNSLALIQTKEAELKTYIIDLAQKNHLIDTLQNPTPNKTAEIDYDVQDLLEEKIFTNEGWEQFKTRFKAIYPDFFSSIKDSTIAITEAEIRLLVLMRLQLNGTDMASVLGISPQSVRACKMRLKKKLQPNGYSSVEAFLKYITA